MWMRKLGTVSATLILLLALLAPPAMAIGLEAEDLVTRVDLGAIVQKALGDLWAWLGFWSHESDGELPEATFPFHDPAAQEALFHGANSETEGEPPGVGCYVDPNG